MDEFIDTMQRARAANPVEAVGCNLCGGCRKVAELEAQLAARSPKSLTNLTQIHAVFNWEHRLDAFVSNRWNSNVVTHLRTIVSVFGHYPTE